MLGKRIKSKGVCPRCKGTGFARQFNREQKYPETIRHRAELLFDKGFSLRKIAKKIKVKNPQTVKNILSYK